MKPHNFFPTIVITLLLSLSMLSPARAQFHNHHNHHRPQWVTVHHCDAATRYIYFPEQDFYYDMINGVYVYPSGETWIYSEAVPAVYAHIDLAFVPIIELDITVERPYLFHHDHVVWYRTYNYDYDYVRYYRGNGHHGHYVKHHQKPRHGHYGYYEVNKHRDSNHSNSHYRDHDRNDHNRGNSDYKRDNDHRQGNGNRSHSEYKGNSGKGNNKGTYSSNKESRNNDNGHRGKGSGNERKSNRR